MRFYWCVSCGYHGDFQMYRQRNIKCESCDYEDLAEYHEDEWKSEDLDKRHQEDRNNEIYDGRYKYKEIKTIGKGKK